MRATSATRAFFDRGASDYWRHRERFFLRTLRHREEACVMRLLDPRPGESVLDAGCGAGYYSMRVMARGTRAYGVDVSPRMVEEARARGVEASVADLATLSLGRRFDKVLCAGVLEFCADPGAALARLAEHVEEHGVIVILVPRRSVAGWAYALYHRSHGLRIALFDPEGLRAMAHGLSLDCVELPSSLSLVARFHL